jgi:hypothetical protein
MKKSFRYFDGSARRANQGARFCPVINAQPSRSFSTFNANHGA